MTDAKDMERLAEDNLAAGARPWPKALGGVFWCAAAAACAAALVVAVGGFSWGLPDGTHIQSYHPDEQNITYSLRNMKPSDLDFNPHFFGNPTFYTYQVGALALAASTAGILPREVSEDYWLSHPEAVRRFYEIGRGLTFAYAVLSILLVYLVARRIAGARAGLVAAALYAALPATAVHSHYMTVNSSAVFWSLAAILFFMRLQERPSWGNYVLAGVFTGLAISTKMNNLFLPLGLVTAHLFAAGEKSFFARFGGGRLYAALAIALAAFVIGSPYYLFSYESVQSDPHSQMNVSALLNWSTPISTLLGDFWNHLSASCGWVMAGVFLVAVPAALLSGARRRLAPLLAVAIPFLLLAAKSGWWAFPSRMMPLFALLAIMAASVAMSSSKSVRVVSAVALIAGLVATIPWNLAYYSLIKTEHVRAVSSQWIEANVPEGSEIIVLDEPYFDDPDIIYENALHQEHVSGPRYKVTSLDGQFERLKAASGRWLVVPQRFVNVLPEKTGVPLREYAARDGFTNYVEFKCPFEVFGWELRDWVPADMVQNYPVYVFERPPALAK